MLNVQSITAAWLLILVSGILEILFSISLKYSDGFSKPFYSVLAIVSASLSLWLMSLSLKQIPIGTAYAVWAGIGAAGTAIVGLLMFGESASSLRLMAIGMVIIGIVLLQLLA